MTSHQEELKHLGSTACGTDKNHCQSEEELSFKAMYQLIFENKLFQVPALKHLELILLSRACWSGHAYETCLCAFWKISHATSLLELLLCYFKEMTGFDQHTLLKKPFFVCTQKIEYNFVVQMSSLPSAVCLACHREGRDDKLPLSDVAQAWVRWGWLFGWQAGENSFGSRSQCFLTLHREEFESLKWLSATYLVKLLGISKFTPAAV